MHKIIHRFKKPQILITIAIASVVLSAVMLTPSIVSARNTSTGNDQSGSDTSGSTVSNSNSNSNSNSSTGAQKKLQGQNLEKCQNREMAINNVMTRVGDRGEKQIAVIESIQQKVQTFYAEKNISIDNYDELVANVETKKRTATTSMNTVRTMKNGFSCNSDDPKGTATQFKSRAMTQSDDVTEYKNAVHDLVVAIKTALTPSVTTEEN